MSIFKKKKEEVPQLSQTEKNQPKHLPTGDSIQIKVLGTGCKKCNLLESAAKEALQELGIESAIEHVTDFAQIAAYGVMTTPALVINEKVVSYGKTLSRDEVISLIKTAMDR